MYDLLCLCVIARRSGFRSIKCGGGRRSGNGRNVPGGREKGSRKRGKEGPPDRAHSIDIDGRIDHQDRHTRGFVTEFWNLGLSNRSRTHKPSAIGYIQPAASGLRFGRRHADRFDRSRPRIDRTWSHLRQPWNLDEKKKEMAWVGSKSG